MTKTGINKWPRRPEQQQTNYRAADFLCPNCGTSMILITPGFDFDVVPEEIKLYFSCRDVECGTKILVDATGTAITDET